MIVGVLYAVYFIVIIIAFLVCYFLTELFSTSDNKHEFTNILLNIFIASIIGIIFIFVFITWSDTSNLSDTELIALNVLIIITFILPIIVIIILVFIKENKDLNKDGNKISCYKDPCDKELNKDYNKDSCNKDCCNL